MKLHILVEGPSEERFFQGWGPRLLRGHTLSVHKHQGKGTLPKPGEPLNPKRRGLLDQLPYKLKALDESLDPAREAVVVLVDTDEEAPEELRRNIEAWIKPLTHSDRIRLAFATEELEAYYLGDKKALANAYPEFDAKLAATYKPDSVIGTWEFFGRVIRDPGNNKVAWAEAMGEALSVRPKENLSPSFGSLCKTLGEVSAPTSAATPQRKPRKAGVATPTDRHGRRRR